MHPWILGAANVALKKNISNEISFRNYIQDENERASPRIPVISKKILSPGVSEARGIAGGH